MFFLIAMLIMMSVFVIKNEKISSTSRTMYLAVVGGILGIWILFSVLL